MSQIEWDKVSNGTVSIKFYAKDNLGTINSAEIIVRKDAILPVIMILAPLADEDFEVSSPNFDVFITEENLESTWYTVEGTIAEFPFVGSTGTIDQDAWNDVPEGEVTITFYAEDSAENINFAEVTIRKDSILPVITILTPSEGSKFSDTSPNFNLSINEEYLQSLWYTLEVTLTEYPFDGNSGTIDQDAWDNLVDGNVIITFYAQDEAGNIGMETVTIVKESKFKISGYYLFVVIAILGIVSIILKERLKLRRS